MLRLFVLVLAFAILVAGPFAIWGTDIESVLTIDGATALMRGYGHWAWVAGLVLIVSDIVLPIPSTAVMAALGVIYGPLVGGLVASAGSVLAGLTGYGICRALGRGTAERLAGHEGLREARRLFDHWGGWMVAASRWLPVLPETISFLAGLTAMSFPRYVAALACGAIPLGFTFAVIGHLGAEAPILTLVIAALLPLVLWAGLRPFIRRPLDEEHTRGD